MPNLIPTTAMNPKHLDAGMRLQDLFESEATRVTRERVINYLYEIYIKYSNRKHKDITRINIVTEEFFLAMPTMAAFTSETELVTAIVMHSQGNLPDEAMKGVLVRFADTHTFVYKDGSRECKSGNFQNWTRDVPLYYVKHAHGLSWGHTVNPIQGWLLKLLEEKRTGKIFEFQWWKL